MSSSSFFCVDGHTCGNPVRLVAGGGPALAGATMSEKRQDFLARYDWIRQALMFEPRGHAMMSGSILYPPLRPECDIAILFIETSGCLPMCGHGTIGTVTMGVEHGLIRPKDDTTLMLDTPAGPVRAEIERNGRYVESVRLFNVPSYLHAAGVTVDCPGLGADDRAQHELRRRPRSLRARLRGAVVQRHAAARHARPWAWHDGLSRAPAGEGGQG